MALSSSNSITLNNAATRDGIHTKPYHKLPGCLKGHLEINIKEAEKQANSTLHIRKFYTVYLIETKYRHLKSEGIDGIQLLGLLTRRYTEFEQLRAYLETTYQWAIVPPLPEKKPLYTCQYVPADTTDPSYVDRRRVGLENFLHRVAAHPVISKDDIFIGFLQQQDGWQGSIKRTGYLQQVERKLRLVSMQDIKQLDPRVEDIKTYGTGLHSNLDNLLRVRSRLAGKLCNVHILHRQYGKVFSEWSVLERDMGDGLQRAGHFFDSFASGTIADVEEEEFVADQLKEYLFFAGALHTLCKHWDVYQHEVEAAQRNLRSKKQERLSIARGKQNLISRLLSVNETEASRNMKAIKLELQIEECEQALQDKTEAVEDFSQKALQEYEQFQHKKVIDLKQTMANYISVQIKMAKKGLQTWTNIRECIENIP